MKEKKQKSSRYTRGVILVAVLAVLILLINVITVTFSWFAPDSASGTHLQFKQEDDGLRSEDCALSCYAYTNGAYAESASSSITCTATASTDPTEGLTKFKIKIVNHASTATNVSLLLNTALPAGLTIGVFSPTNSVHTYADGANAGTQFLIRNAYISAQSAEVGSGELEIEAFMRKTGSGNFTLNASNIKILYN